MTTLARLKELHAKATPGRWNCAKSPETEYFYIFPTEENRGSIADLFNDKYDEHNAALIAAMRNALPALLKIAELAGNVVCDTYDACEYIDDNVRNLNAAIAELENGGGA